MLISPAFHYERVEGDLFLTREEAIGKFREMDFFNKYPFMSSPLYLDFLKGRRELTCTPWGNPTRNPLGWKSPCYLITDGYYRTFRRTDGANGLGPVREQNGSAVQGLHGPQRLRGHGAAHRFLPAEGPAAAGDMEHEEVIT